MTAQGAITIGNTVDRLAGLGPLVLEFMAAAGITFENIADAVRPGGWGHPVITGVTHTTLVDGPEGPLYLSWCVLLLPLFARLLVSGAQCITELGVQFLFGELASIH